MRRGDSTGLDPDQPDRKATASVSATVTFLVNLRNSTASRTFRAKLHPPGYLVPPAYLTAGNCNIKPSGFSRRGAIIVENNGLFDDIVTASQPSYPANPTGTGLAQRAAELAATVDPAPAPPRAAARYKPTATHRRRRRHHRGTLVTPRPQRAQPPQPAGGTPPSGTTRPLSQSSAVWQLQIPPGCDYLPVASAQDYDSAYDAASEFTGSLTAAALLASAPHEQTTQTTRQIKIPRQNPPGSIPPCRPAT